MVKRSRYLDKIIRSMWDGQVKVVTGIRRCGKSVLLFELFTEYLKSSGVAESQIIKIELDRRKFYKYRNPITLCEYVESVVSAETEKKFYLLIDEVQFTQRVIDKENGGHGSGINAGIDAASGRFFKVIDSDDWIVTESLGSILDELMECHSDAVITGYHTVNTASNVILPYGTGQQLPPDRETVQKLGEEYAALRCFGSRMVTMDELMEEVDNIPAVQSFHGIMYRTDFYRDCNIRMTSRPKDLLIF